MDWKTTTGGDTILHLDDHERDLLMQRASLHGDMAMTEALKRFDSTKRQHPHVNDFAKILELAFPLTVSGVAARTRVNADAAGGNAKAAKPSNPYAETLEIERSIRKFLSSNMTEAGATSASMQAAAMLYMALATINQTRVLGAKLDLLASDGVWKATQGRKDA